MSIEKVGQSLARTILVNLFIMISASLVSCGNGGSPNQAPVFTSAEELSVIEQSTATGYFPTAFDADGDALSFSIRGGSDESHFELDPTTGELKFVSAPYFDTPTDVGENNFYKVKLRVSDGSVSSALTLRVNVAPKPKPNIIFIAIDDLNDWVEGFDGHPDTITPNIAELASRGVMFSNAHAPSVLCNPSRASVLTGLAPQHTGVLKNKQVPLREPLSIPV